MTGVETIAVGGEIIVDNSPIKESKDDTVSSVVGLRRMADVDFRTAERLGRLRLSKDLIVRSALEFEEVSKEMQEAGKKISDIDVKELKEIVNASEYGKHYLYNAHTVNFKPASKKVVIESKHATDPAFRSWDATLVTNMLATGVIDIEDPIYNENSEEFFYFNPVYKDELTQIYRLLSLINEQEIYNIAPSLDNLKDTVRRYDSLEQSLLQLYGTISFGKVFSWTSDEKDLIIPSDISSRYDVYWIELPVTFRDLVAEDLTEIVVNFGLPVDSLALELIPFRYLEEVKVVEEYSPPEIGMEFKGVKISLGEFFHQTVKYTYLKPVVLSFGVREPSFSWSLQESAILAGSHKFVAVIGIPKGTKALSMAMSAHVRFKAKLWEFTGAGIAGTQVETRKIEFARAAVE